MIDPKQVPEHLDNNFVGILGGLLIGSMAGAIAMLLLAPQSGKLTRTQIQQKSIQLRDRAGEMMDDAVAQVRSNANKVTIGGRDRIKELKQHGQELAVEQLDRVAEAAQAGKKAILST